MKGEVFTAFLFFYICRDAQEREMLIHPLDCLQWFLYSLIFKSTCRYRSSNLEEIYCPLIARLYWFLHIATVLVILYVLMNLIFFQNGLL